MYTEYKGLLKPWIWTWWSDRIVLIGAVWHTFQLLILRQNQGSSVKHYFSGEVILD
jgi:hypothetical protein